MRTDGFRSKKKHKSVDNRVLTMCRASCIFFIAIVLATQFSATDAGLEFWIQFFDRWLFGSKNPLLLTGGPRILEGMEAEQKFIDNEYHKLHRPEEIDAEIRQTYVDANVWIERRNNSWDFIRRWAAQMALDALWEKQMMLKQELRFAKEDYDLEPFCHHRHHNQNRAATDLVCFRAFQNPYFQNKGWRLDKYNSDGKFCSRVTIYSLNKTERNENHKLLFYREARRCQAYTLKSSSSLDVEKKSYFGVYLISHNSYMARKQFSYFVFLSTDNMGRAVTEEEAPSDPKSKRKAKFKKVLNYLAFWREKQLKILAFIES